jgi:DNA polymerase-1
MDVGELTRDPADMYAKNGRAKAFSKAEALRLFPKLVEQNRAETLRRMVANTPENYRLITDETEFSALLADLLDEPIIAVDTETTGLDVYTDHIVGISLTLPCADYHVYIPVAHDEGEQLSRDYVLGGLRPFIVDEALGKVLHNAN